MKKFLCAVLALLLVVTMSGCQKENPEVVQKEFDDLMMEYFIEDVSSDYLNMHFSLKNPSKYGIENVEVTLGEIEMDENDTTYKDRLDKLNTFDVKLLTPQQAITCETLKWYCQLQLEWLALEEDYSFVFTPNSGINNNLITNFTEFELRSEQDCQDLITLVKDTTRFMDLCIDYTLEQAEKGIVQSDAIIDSIIEQCERFIEHKEDNEVIKAFNLSITELDLDNEQQYKDELKTAVLDCLIPAYEKVISMYEGLKGQCVVEGGVGNYEGGKEYYSVLFKDNSSSSTTVEEYKKLLKNAIDDTFDEFISTAQKHMDSYLQYYDDTYETEGCASYGFTDPYEVFKHLKAKMSVDFPEIPEVDYTINFLDESVVSDNIAAYYLLSPIDDVSNNVVKMNPNFCQESPNDMCITLSHEGYPGHLYQHTYYFTNHPDQLIRDMYSFGGYDEGWAMHGEEYGYKYFAPDKYYAKIASLENTLTYYLYTYFDIIINYDCDEDAFKKAVNEYFSFDSEEDLEDFMYSFIGDPAMFAPYSIGLFEMNTIYAKAKKKLGVNYSDKEFNEVILDTGSTSFDVLKDEVDKYINSK